MAKVSSGPDARIKKLAEEIFLQIKPLLVSNTGKIATALLEAQRNMVDPVKNKKVDVTKGGQFKYSFRYADLANCMKAVRKPLLNNGIVISQPMTAKTESNILTTVLIHTESGQIISSSAELPKCSNMQEFGSAVSYMRRYQIVCLTGIVADDDDDANISVGNDHEVGRVSNGSSDESSNGEHTDLARFMFKENTIYEGRIIKFTRPSNNKPGYMTLETLQGDLRLSYFGTLPGVGDQDPNGCSMSVIGLVAQAMFVENKSSDGSVVYKNIDMKNPNCHFALKSHSEKEAVQEGMDQQQFFQEIHARKNGKAVATVMKMEEFKLSSIKDVQQHQFKRFLEVLTSITAGAGK